MAYITETSIGELTRIGKAAYEGKRVRVSLAFLDTEGFTLNSPVSEWDSIKVSGGGYEDFFFVVPEGDYKTGTAQHESGGVDGAPVQVTFSATGVGFQYNRVYHVISEPNGSGGWNEITGYISYLGTETSTVVLSSEQSVVYPTTLFVND